MFCTLQLTVKAPYYKTYIFTYNLQFVYSDNAELVRVERCGNRMGNSHDSQLARGGQGGFRHHLSVHT